MPIQISDDAMSDDSSGARTQRMPHGSWRVSWLPGRELGRNQAITAMTLAEAVTSEPDATRWPFIDGWAAELGLTREQAVSMIRHTADPGRGTGQ